MKVLLCFCLLILSAFSHASIVTTIKPLTLISNAVTDGVEQAQQLLPIGASAHHYALKPSERLAIQRAELVIWVGADHESFLAKLMANHAHVLSLRSVSSQALTWRDLNSLQGQPKTLDSHLWLAPDNAIKLAYKIAEIRGKQRPEYAAKYQQNAHHFAEQVKGTLVQIQQRFATLKQRDYLAYHDAYQYLEASLGLHYRGSLTVSPEQKAGLKHVLQIKQQAQAQAWQCLLTEPQFDRKFTEQVFGKQMRYAMVDENFSQASSYSMGLQQIADTIFKCLQ
ncbi:metal ABC transporter solute-binding protein, Zn/Mn family [Agitococcus lubricus]|uniref:High-affinity zinc uptake system protein ZnuA n=1 Tax=Agitococcus lubricus TaxID=1077255 RepID=A0A2T5J445_9GAMM|nr:zinc ABC transporter substrate-binding protein [Agitococcus lubricus]PTQ91384.1 zinc transport system substrate-binding protein [Agitococcus lubricus]